jgi:hypothetical protein
MYAGIRYWWYEGAPREVPFDGPPRRDVAPDAPREPRDSEDRGEAFDPDRTVTAA